LKSAGAYIPIKGRISTQDLLKKGDPNKKFPDYVEKKRNSEFSDVEKKAGIKYRYLAAPDKTIADMASSAIEDIGELPESRTTGIILATSSITSPESIHELKVDEAASLLVLKEISKNFGFHAMEVVHEACSGFVGSVVRANEIFSCPINKINKIIVVAAERILNIVDPNNKNFAPLFGDGAGAVVISREPSEGSREFLGSNYKKIDISEALYRDENGIMQMPNGKMVYQVAVREMTNMIYALMNKIGISKEELTLIPHQANSNIVQDIIDKISPISSLNIVPFIGNVSSAGIPTALSLAQRNYDLRHYIEKIRPNKNLGMTAIGTGGHAYGVLFGPELA